MAGGNPASAEHRGSSLLTPAIPAVLIGLAALGWLWSARMSRMDMVMAGAFTLASFLVAWAAMMAAMMFPAIVPVVRLYARAAAQGRVAPLPFFIAGYLIVWSLIGLPAFFAWRRLMGPLATGEVWAARLAGSVLIAAALYQLTPLKSVCLRHCRSPLSFFMRYGGNLNRPLGAIRMGCSHGGFCLGCCWALMAVLVAVGTMQLWWMIGLAVLIFLEKNARWGWQVARAAAVVLACTGVALLVAPAAIRYLT